MEPLQVLTKWRRVFMHWQLGVRDKGDPEADAVVDHRELTILLRAENSALVALLLQKSVFTALEYTACLEVEAEQLSKEYESKFPGFSASEEGITLTMPDALATIDRIGWARPGRQA
jgi:hypothetical protein